MVGLLSCLFACFLDLLKIDFVEQRGQEALRFGADPGGRSVLAGGGLSLGGVDWWVGCTAASVSG